MKIFVSGATGLVGTELARILRAAGHDVRRLVRAPAQTSGDDVLWNPQRGELDARAIAGANAVINLSGESIAEGRWTGEKKHRILESRINSTRTLAETFSQMPDPPQVFLSASAIGYYGSRGDELLTEESGPGSGDYLSGVCRDWEAATQPAADKGIRVVLARFGVILSSKGGALKKMLLPFKLGLGGRIGNGRQYMSWVAMDDVIGALMHCLASGSLRGPVNIVAPDPVTNVEYTATLARVLKRPAISPMPAFAARLIFGQMADELLLSSQRVEPKKLLSHQYAFRFATLEPALRHLLGKE
jgi:uncharacterized protein (TIGR01777 family)